MLYPNEIYDKLEDVSVEKLINNNIKGVILDVDNTLIDKTTQVLSDAKIKWVKLVIENNIKVCILSNTLKKEKIQYVSKQLGIPYFMFATKPLKRGFKKCIKLFNLQPNQICTIGDQIFTDVLGGNKMGMYTIYVYPINPEDCSITTALKRPLERKIVNKYLKKEGIK